MSQPKLKPNKRIGVNIGPSGGNAFKRYHGRKHSGGGPRGKIRLFSANSRRRMRRKMVRYNWGKIVGSRRALWVTFTARSGLPSDFKRWLDTWRKRLERAFPGVWFLWRVEYQDRGVVHLHLIPVFRTQAAALRARSIVVGWWLDIAGRDNASGVAQCVKMVKGEYGVAAYVSDASKVHQAIPPEGDEVGRWWGIRGEAVSLADLAEIIAVYGPKAFYEFRRFVRGLRRGRRRAMNRRRYRGSVRDSVEFFDAGRFVEYLKTVIGDLEVGPEEKLE